MQPRYYSPRLDRALISRLYHEAKRHRLPMTKLANQFVEEGLSRSREQNIDPQFWESTGRIRAVPDLAGSQLLVRLEGWGRTRGRAVDTILGEIRRRFELDWLTIRFPGDREFTLRGNEMKKYQAFGGDPVYVYIFPKTPDSLHAANK
jgi:hypothetical protein